MRRNSKDLFSSLDKSRIVGITLWPGGIVCMQVRLCQKGAQAYTLHQVRIRYKVFTKRYGIRQTLFNNTVAALGVEAAVDDEYPLVARPEMFCDFLNGEWDVIHREHGFDEMGIGESLVIIQPLNNVFKGGDGIFVNGDAEKAMCRGIQPYPYFFRAYCLDHGIERFKEKSCLVFMAAAVLVGAGVGAVSEELMEQIPVG